MSEMEVTESATEPEPAAETTSIDDDDDFWLRFINITFYFWYLSTVKTSYFFTLKINIIITQVIF